MKILNKAKNGTITACIKTWGEMTADEHEFQSWDVAHHDEFETFLVERRKDGTLINVKGAEYTQEELKRILKKSDEYNQLVDNLKLMHDHPDRFDEVIRHTSDAQRRASAKYDAAHTKGIYLKFNLETDADILAWLDTQPNKQGAIKDLIRGMITQRKGEEQQGSRSHSEP